jgi:hypothetical protein
MPVHVGGFLWPHIVTLTIDALPLAPKVSAALWECTPALETPFPDHHDKSIGEKIKIRAKTVVNCGALKIGEGPGVVRGVRLCYKSSMDATSRGFPPMCAGWWTRYFGAGLLAVSLSILPIGGAHPDEDTHGMIVPGHKVGRFELGAKLPAFYKMLGKPVAEDAALGRSYVRWRVDGRKGQTIAVYALRTPKGDTSLVRQILVQGTEFMTSHGISAGSSIVAIWKEFPDLAFRDIISDGSAHKYELYDDEKRGIAIALRRGRDNERSAVRCAIIVHLPGEPVSDSLVSLIATPRE